MIHAHNPNGEPARETMVCNVSKTTRFPVERADNLKPAPKTRPDPEPWDIGEPAPAPVQGPPQVSALRADLEKRLASRPNMPAPRNFMQRVAQGTRAADTGPPEGVGYGAPPPGGVKVR